MIVVNFGDERMLHDDDHRRRSSRLTGSAATDDVKRELLTAAVLPLMLCCGTNARSTVLRELSWTWFGERERFSYISRLVHIWSSNLIFAELLHCCQYDDLRSPSRISAPREKILQEKWFETAIGHKKSNCENLGNLVVTVCDIARFVS